MYNKINSLKNFNEDVISLKHDILNTNPMYGDKNSKLEKIYDEGYNEDYTTSIGNLFYNLIQCRKNNLNYNKNNFFLNTKVYLIKECNFSANEAEKFVNLLMKINSNKNTIDFEEVRLGVSIAPSNIKVPYYYIDYSSSHYTDKFIKNLRNYLNDNFSSTNIEPHKRKRTIIYYYGGSSSTTLKNINTLTKRFVSIMGYKKSYDIYYLLNNSVLTLHELDICLPKIKNRNQFNSNEEYENYKEEVYQFIRKILINLKHKEDIMRILPYSNYKRVRNAQNKRDMLNQIAIISNSIGGIQRGIIGSEEKTEHNLLIDYTVKNPFIKFSKLPDEINTIGKKTLCCFSPDGLAKSLLVPAIKSPIAGIFQGNINNKTFFMFIWEIVIKNEKGYYETDLILDNLEATSSLSKDEFTVIYKYLKDNTSYKNIFLGSMRNDIEDDCKSLFYNTELFNRPNSLMGYESNFTKYHYDDSKLLYTVINRESDNNIILDNMDKSYLHRCSYLERDIYEEKSDTNDFLKIDIKSSPNFVIHDNNEIFGYFVTRLYNLDENKNILFNSRYSKNLPTILYIEDVYLINNLHIKKYLNNIFNEVEKFVNENNIEYISASFNKYSKPFEKRMKNLKFIKDTRFTDASAILSKDKIEKFVDLSDKNFIY